MGSLFHAEAAFFCLCWAALIMVGYVLEGWIAGALLSMGMMSVLMATSAAIINRTEDFNLERTVRWSILIGAGTVLALVNLMME